MLATPELIREAAQAAEMAARLPRWRTVPLYREADLDVVAQLESIRFPRDRD